MGKELRAFLDYVAGKNSEDDYVKRLEAAVKEAKKNREWRHEYMTLLMRDQENIEKGRIMGEDMILDLIQKLMENQRSDEISRVKEDKEYREKLYKEYGIYESEI